MFPPSALNTNHITPLNNSARIFGEPLFKLPGHLEASRPPEARGLRRDEVRLMVSHYQTHRVTHTVFTHFAEYLSPGDVLVINTSGTLKAALQAQRENGQDIHLHVSTHRPNGNWAVELRRLDGDATAPLLHAKAGELITFPDGGSLQLLGPLDSQRPPNDPIRLWEAAFDLPVSMQTYLQRYGFPIRYSYVTENWDADYYQTVYARQPGSAEMPSAGRAFTSQIISQLVSKGTLVVPLTLHTGVASPEAHEPLYEEWFQVPAITAQTVNNARARGSHIIAVGTTVVRALETQTGSRGYTQPGEGWTDLIISPDDKLTAVDALLTGLHAPEASHLHMLHALAGREHLEISYRQALSQQYLWHEFGDVHLLLP